MEVTPGRRFKALLAPWAAPCLIAGTEAAVSAINPLCAMGWGAALPSEFHLDLKLLPKPGLEVGQRPPILLPWTAELLAPAPRGGVTRATWGHTKTAQSTGTALTHTIKNNAARLCPTHGI